MSWLLLLLACSLEARVERAEAALRKGDLSAAEGRYRAILDDSPDQVDALYGLGWIYHQQQEQDRARDYFNRCKRVAPEDFRCHRGLGSVALAEDNRVLARKHYEDALALSPEEPRTLSSLGWLLISEQDFEGALERFDRASAADTTRGEYGYGRAFAMHRLERHEEALVVIEQALEQDIEERRFRGLMLELRALILVSMTTRSEVSEDCASRAPAVLAWLDAADASLDQAMALEVDLPDVYAARRRVHRRRSLVTEQCPGHAGSETK